VIFALVVTTFVEPTVAKQPQILSKTGPEKREKGYRITVSLSLRQSGAILQFILFWFQTRR
jgi:hypothetical protein